MQACTHSVHQLIADTWRRTELRHNRSVNGADNEANCSPCVIKGEMSEIMLLFHFADNDTILQPAMLDGH